MNDKVNQLWAEGARLLAESDKLIAEGDNLLKAQVEKK